MDKNITKPTITITIRAFANIKQAMGESEITLELPGETTVQDLLAVLANRYPAINDFLNYIIVAVNREYARKDRQLVDGDQVAVFPPVSGGSAGFSGDELTFVGITDKVIDSQELLDRVTESGAGAVVTFCGIVRDNNLGRSVDFLEYEAYEEMATAALHKVVEQARERWPKIRRVAIVHRIGRLELGELAVMAAVGAPHRDDGAFEAARFAIDRIKEIVPIWKKEGWAGGEEWLEGDYLPQPGE